MLIIAFYCALTAVVTSSFIMYLVQRKLDAMEDHYESLLDVHQDDLEREYNMGFDEGYDTALHQHDLPVPPKV